MSHSVKVQVAINCEQEIKKIASLKSELAVIDKDYAQHLQAEINEVLTKLEKIERTIKEIDGQEIEEEKLESYLRNISSSIKEVANLKSSINYGQALVKGWEQKEKAIKKLVKENGLVAVLSLEDLQNSGGDITVENLKSKIGIRQFQQIELERINKITNHFKKTLISSALPINVKGGLVNRMKKARSYQEISDFIAYVEELTRNYESMELLSKSLIKSLEEIEFKHKNSKYKLLENGLLKLTITSHKNLTKDFELNILSDQSMDWQFGNYENHLCDADGAKFREKLKSNKIKTTTMVITRNVSNSRRLKQRAMKERKI